jgi:hypothetical protein
VSIPGRGLVDPVGRTWSLSPPPSLLEPQERETSPLTRSGLGSHDGPRAVVEPADHTQTSPTYWRAPTRPTRYSPIPAEVSSVWRKSNQRFRSNRSSMGRQDQQRAGEARRPAQIGRLRSRSDGRLAFSAVEQKDRKLPMGELSPMVCQYAEHDRSGAFAL